MKKTNKKIFLNFFVVFILLAMLGISLVSGLGFSFPYSKSTPLIVAPGEVKDIHFMLATSSAEGNLVVKAEFIDDAGIATLTDKNLEYSVSPERGTIVNVRISVPETVAEGTEYIVNVKFSDITPSENTGTVVMGLATSQAFKVLVQKPPVTETPKEEGIGTGWIILGIIIVIALIVIIYYIIKSRRK